jgi:hypothetical protein
MRYLMTTTSNDSAPTPEMMEQMGQYVQEGFQAGWLVATGGLSPQRTHIRSSGGKVTVVDGPFAEAKEAVVGFALIEVESLEQAMELSAKFWAIVGDGEGDIQEVFGP